jgi:hypothetical protein
MWGLAHLDLEAFDLYQMKVPARKTNKLISYNFLTENSPQWTSGHGVHWCLYSIAQLGDHSSVDGGFLGSPVMATSFSTEENSSIIY